MKLKKCVIKTTKCRLLVFSVCKTQPLILQMVLPGKVPDTKTFRIEFWLIPSCLGQWNDHWQSNKFVLRKINLIRQARNITKDRNSWTTCPRVHFTAHSVPRLCNLCLNNAAFLMIDLASCNLEKDPISSKERWQSITPFLMTSSIAAMLPQFTTFVPAYCSAKKSENCHYHQWLFLSLNELENFKDFY